MKQPEPPRSARILDCEDETFAAEYEDTLGRTNLMRLDAVTYEQAIQETKDYLGIDADNRDSAGAEWRVE